MTTCPRPIRSVPPTRPPFHIDEFAAALAGASPARPGADLIHLLVDFDHLSHADSDTRVDDGGLQDELTALDAAICRVGRLRMRGACSSLTARTHLGVLATLPNNSWRIRAGRDGADQLLEEELEYLGSRPSTGQIVLVTGDHAHAESVARLVGDGIPVWVLARPRTLSRQLRDACSDYRFLPYRGATQLLPARVAAILVSADGAERS